MTDLLRNILRHHSRLAVAAFLLASVASSPAPAAERAPVTSLLEMRRENVVIQEWDLSCGAAALATILRYQYGDPVSEREIAEGLIRRKEYIANPTLVRIRQGFSLLDLKRFVDRRGYEGIGYGNLDLKDLIEFAPVLVPVNINGYNHFVVFRGLAAGLALLADPAFGNRTMRVERFENAWLSSETFGHVGFVVARRNGEHAPDSLGPHRTDLFAPSGAVLREALPFSVSR